MSQTAPHVLVIGGGYGGMSVISNLVNLSNGGKQLPCPVQIPELTSLPTTKPNVTLLDERDGICTLNFLQLKQASPTDCSQFIQWARRCLSFVGTFPGKRG